MDKAAAERLVATAQPVCPYSNANPLPGGGQA
jgi:organic hydroperoxide reductase OsmC/OhrA